MQGLVDSAQGGYCLRQFGGALAALQRLCHGRLCRPLNEICSSMVPRDRIPSGSITVTWSASTTSSCRHALISD